ncbi:MAG: hypothetical protein ABEK50_01710 [bacterium]
MSLVLTLSGCVHSIGRPTLLERLPGNYQAEESWSVKVSYWPGRLNNPYSKNASRLESVLQYQMLPKSSENSPRRILVTRDSTQFLIEMNSGGNVTLISRVIDQTPAGVIKTKQVVSNVLQDRALFDPNWSPSQPMFGFHPDMTASDSHERIRFDRGAGHAGKWIVQTTSDRGDVTRITLRHRPSSSRVVFHWEQGAPWWSKARWYRSDRLIALAEKIE